MTEETEKWIMEAEEMDMISAVTSLAQKLQNYMIHKNSKGDKVTGPVVERTKRILEFITVKAIEVYKQNIILETKMQERERYNAIMEEFANKITRQPIASMEDAAQMSERSKESKLEEYPIIITMKEEGEDVEAVKKNIKNLCKENSDLPIPRDVIITKDKKMILKMKNRVEIEKMKTAI